MYMHFRIAVSDAFLINLFILIQKENGSILGFEIKKKGEFIQYDIAPACGVKEVMGRWEAIGKNEIKVYFESEEKESYTLSIVSCDEDILKIKH